ncbi:MAG: UxaA family hydrolase [Bacillota bacterium]|nr:UxaA family hydrolase [Bacillota bacterium]
MNKEYLIVNQKDNVATVLVDLPAGKELEISEGYSVLLLDNIALGHKFALSNITSGEPVIKYGEVIGVASCDIKPGNHVHVHNIDSARGRGDKE